MNRIEQVQKAMHAAPSYQAFAAAAERLSELGSQARDKQTALAALREELSRIPPEETPSASAAALALVSGIPNRRRELSVQIDSASSGLAVLTEAIALQGAAVNRAREVLASEVAAALRAEHTAVMDQIATAMRSLGVAAAAEAELLTALEAEGLSGSLPAVAPGGWIPGPGSRAQAWAQFVEQQTGYAVIVQ